MLTIYTTAIDEFGLGGESRPGSGANRQTPHRSREAWLQTSGDSEIGCEELAKNSRHRSGGGGESG